MLQILLIGLGLYILIKGNIKITDTREIVRPQSAYLALIMFAYGIANSFLPDNQPVYLLMLYGSLMLISAVFVIKGGRVTSNEAIVQSVNTKRNVIILLVAIAIMVAILYLFTYVIKY